MCNKYLLSAYDSNRRLIIRLNTTSDHLVDMMDKLRSADGVDYVSCMEITVDDTVNIKVD